MDGRFDHTIGWWSTISRRWKGGWDVPRWEWEERRMEDVGGWMEWKLYLPITFFEDGP